MMENRRERVADQAMGVLWIILGGIIIAISLSMKVNEHLGATFLTGPGFVPMLLGGALCILGFVILMRAASGKVKAFLDDPRTVSEKRALGALALLLVYSLVLVGHIPFSVATTLFISSFILIFNLPAKGRWAFAKLIASSVVTAAITSAVIVLVFQNVFYVRLP